MSILKNSRVVVTGGAGLIGSHIIDQLIELKPSRIVVLDDFSRGTQDNLRHALGSAPELLEVVTGNIADPKTVDRVVEGADYIFHQAAIRITHCAENPRLAMDILVGGTFNIMDACVRYKVKKLVAASSASVYGQATAFPTPENHGFEGNRTFYGGCKVANEQMLRAFNEMHGLKYVGLRYMNVYGPRMDVFGAYTEVMIRWLNCIDQGKPPLIFGDGSQMFDFTYITDIALSNIKAMEASASDACYNVGTGIGTTLLQLLELMLKVADSKLKPEFREARKVGTNVVKRIGDTSRAQNEIGFSAQVPLVDGIAKLMEWRKRLVKA